MNCIIRNWHIEDAADLAAVLNNRHVLDNLRDGLPFPYTEKDAREYISSVLADSGGSSFCFAITAGGRVVGSIGAFRGGNIHFRTAELGYYVAQPYWGRGIASSAVRQICGYIFENTDIIRIFAEPFSDNAASCRVLEKTGFVCEGILRKNAVKNGVVKDMKIYSLINTREL